MLYISCPSSARWHIVTCPAQLPLTLAEWTYFSSQIKRRPGPTAGFAKRSSVDVCGTAWFLPASAVPTALRCWANSIAVLGWLWWQKMYLYRWCWLGPRGIFIAQLQCVAGAALVVGYMNTPVLVECSVWRKTLELRGYKRFYTTVSIQDRDALFCCITG